LRVGFQTDFTGSTPVKYSSPFYFIYLFTLYYKFIRRRQLNLSRGFCHVAFLLGLPSAISGHLSNTHLHPVRSLNTSTIIECITFSCLSLITRCQSSELDRYRLTSGLKLIG